MAQPPSSPPSGPDPGDDSSLVAARREKLRKWREELGVDPYGRRVDGLVTLAEARAMLDLKAHEAYKASSEAAKSDPAAKVDDHRPRALVAGRCIQHRAMGKLVFIVLRDHSGDLQISISKSAVSEAAFKIASKLDYGDIVVAGGPVGMTNNGEICIWADRFEVHCKSLVPPPEKFHGLQDDEIRYRQRYVDMYANPETIATFKLRSQIISGVRRFMERRAYIEVETPMMQPIAGGAAARPFITHHNALNMPLYMRVAPELYLKRLLVGGLPKVFEINRNFRNEGIDRSHNPEFTMLEVYEAFGDCWSMLGLTESLVYEMAAMVAGHAGSDDQREKDPDHVQFPYGDLQIDFSRPFRRVAYGDLFKQRFGFDMSDVQKTLAKATEMRIENAGKLDHWLLVSALFDAHCEELI
ncbi:MAG TPA: amino acid--tRNA ligase-related protein, partial [Phycisphaerales bacterium]|nr:amino acid--tRNA ligase-related protein [Phycisphaerales bacterium]